jgi:hypothetical protein
MTRRCACWAGAADRSPPATPNVASARRCAAVFVGSGSSSRCWCRLGSKPSFRRARTPAHATCVGASAPNTATRPASHATNGRRSRAKYGIGAIRMQLDQDQVCAFTFDVYCLCWPWSMPGMLPILAPGAAVATGTFNSTLLSTPLASLNTSVSGTVPPLTSGAFRSSSMTW